jgi:excisionase family DNA binding protein
MSKQPDSASRADRLLTDLEACEYLRIRNRQLYAWRMQGLIPFIRIGRAIRYRQRDLDAALDALTFGTPSGKDQA